MSASGPSGSLCAISGGVRSSSSVSLTASRLSMSHWMRFDVTASFVTAASVVVCSAPVDFLRTQVMMSDGSRGMAAIASEAIKAAQRQGCDAVLVDTAGRMQDNEPLMRALSKLINMNDPDLTLFVGEALVGNDAVDQLSKFNERLADLNANARRTKLIDGIVLSKFDTIDDKVGAALSMVYTSGAPVVFVGCGQTYTDLRRLNVKSVVKILLSAK